MKTVLFGVLVAGVVLAAAPRASASLPDAAVVTVPFEFLANHTVLPAGAYRLTADPEDSSLLFIASVDGRHEALLPVIGQAPNSDESKVELVFKQYGGEHYLWKVAAPGEDALELAVPPAGMTASLAKAHAQRANGK